MNRILVAHSFKDTIDNCVHEIITYHAFIMLQCAFTFRLTLLSNFLNIFFGKHLLNIGLPFANVNRIVFNMHKCRRLMQRIKKC